MEIQVKVLNEYTKEINELRREAYYLNYPDIKAKDEFDDISQHVCLFHNEILVGYGRYTSKTPSVLQAWASKGETLPAGNEIVNYSRAAVHSAYQKHHIFKVVSIELLLHSCINKKTKGMCVIEADEKKERNFKKLGWELFGERILAYKPPDGLTLSRYMIFDLQKNLNLVLEKREHLLNKMNEQGITVKSEIFDNFKNNCQCICKHI